jgi:hypothetical protein
MVTKRWVVIRIHNKRALCGDRLEADMRMVEVGSCSTDLGFDFVVEKVTRRNRPLASRWGAVREWSRKRSKTVPVLSLSSVTSFQQIIFPTYYRGVVILHVIIDTNPTHLSLREAQFGPRGSSVDKD